MAKILQFSEVEGRPRPERSGSARPAMAEIVIFPGVRVEYHDEPPKPAGSRGGRRRQAKAAVSA